MDNKLETFVILLVRYDPQLIDHPKFWDWPSVIDCSSDDVELIETFEHPYHDDENQNRNSQANTPSNQGSPTS